jgi:hypothetical protein
MDKKTAEMLNKFGKQAEGALKKLGKQKELREAINILKDPKAIKKFVADQSKRLKACIDDFKNKG